MDPVPDALLHRNLVAPGTEPGPLYLQPVTLTIRPQRRSELYIIIKKVKLSP
jgi:hypothetical protein